MSAAPAAARPARRRTGGMRGGQWLGVAALVVFILLWQVYKWTAGSSLDSIPTPAAFVAQMGRSVSDGAFYDQLLHTLSIAVGAWLIAATVGVVGGILLGLSRTLRLLTDSTIDVLRSVPSIAFVPVALLVFGFSVWTELVIGAYVALWPILLNTWEGVGSTSLQLRDAARTLRIGPLRSATTIRVQAAIPSIFVGLRLGLSLSIALVVVAEMLGNPQGLGYGLMYAQQAFQPPTVFFYVFAIGVIGWIANLLIVRAGRIIFVGHRDSI